MAVDQNKKNLLLYSLYFLFMFGGMGFLQPFLSLHYHEIGFSGVQISAVVAVSSLAVIIAAPQLGLLFDNSQHKKRTLVIAALLIMLTMFLVPYFRIFGLVMLFYSVFRVINTSSISATENLSYRVSAVGNKHQKPAFGSLRMWGSIGFALAALAGGIIFERFGILPGNWLFLVWMVIAIAMLLAMPESLYQVNSTSFSAEKRIRVSSVVEWIFKDRFLLLMVLALALTDTLSDGLRSFEPIFMQDLGLSESVIGLAATLSALIEVPFMIWSDRIIHRFGIRRVILFVFVFDLARRLIVWLFPVGWVVFVMNVVTCVTFTLRLVGTMYLVNLRLPQRYTTTALSFISLTLNGTSHMLNNALSGVIYDLFGARQLYLMSVILCLASLGLALAAGQPEKEMATSGSL